MAIPTIIVLLCCSYVTLASHSHLHTIPIEGYEGKLQDLGQHVEYSKTPVKVIKITKTVAVKVPVPYPVKVVQKVPYPVHINKPYPVPVPQIVHVPVPQAHAKAEPAQHGGGASGFVHKYSGVVQENSYRVHEPSDGHGQNNGQGHSFVLPSEEQGGHSFIPSQDSQSYYGDNGHNFGASGGGDHSSEGFGSYEGGSHYGPSSSGESEESKSYDQAINEYLQKHQQNNGGNSGYH